jgi:hypothetical protein
MEAVSASAAGPAIQNWKNLPRKRNNPEAQLLLLGSTADRVLHYVSYRSKKQFLDH